ncbi:Homeodomain-like protein [Hesseltinella vesiculosa]|uniref:Homeodomain-like protein n=1 Tax=Hesseltinella vesiculosa TaxID=101127 RepID=A0A1X2GRV4_9FUNG|nr:Homeodomain-like protein [Hesseltinella vesiculosa]
MKSALDTTSSIRSLLNPVPAKKRSSLAIDMKQSTGRSKRKRISPDQYQVLTECFQHTDTPNYELREKLSKELNMTNREVQVWFQNRRAKMNRIKLQQKQEHDYYHRQPSLPPSPPPQKHGFRFDPTFSSSLPQSPKSPPPSVSSPSTPSTPTLPMDIPLLSPYMSPIDILATAAEYVQKCDQELQKSLPPANPTRSWRPWL